jgi:branched-chain amino acid transport system ATP-binding protein
VSAEPQPASSEVPELRVQGVTVRFAGIKALDNVSFTVAPGAIHAVIGPNGAGKSTCFNVLSGVYRATEGSVHFGDVELTSLRPHRIANLGVARSFQNIALSAVQSVEENLMLGRHHLTGTGFLTGGLQLPNARREDRRHRARAREIAEFLDLTDKLDTPVGVLSYGDQKRVEVARALCTEPRLLLLDEPVAGMNAEETRRMAALIVEIRAALQITVVLVEHDMGLVMGIADRVTVLDFGRLIADGSPAEIQADTEVIRAYLGESGEVPAGSAEPARPVHGSAEAVPEPPLGSPAAPGAHQAPGAAPTSAPATRETPS